MINRSIAFTLLALTLFTAHTAACQKDAKKSDFHVPAGFDIPAAMQSLFGNYDAKTGTSRYDIPQSTIYNLKGSGFEIGDDIAVSPLWASSAMEDGKQKVVLVTYAVPIKEDGSPTDFECHLCSPLIGAAVFAKNGGQWSVESSRTVVTRGGGYGDPASDIRIIPIGPRRIGIEITAGDLGQGITTSIKAILVPWKGKINEALRTVTEDDNKEAACGSDSDSLPCYFYRKSLIFVTGINKDYFDVVMKLSGTELTDHEPYKAKPVHGFARLSFVDGAYKTIERSGNRTHLEKVIETIQ